MVIATAALRFLEKFDQDSSVISGVNGWVLHAPSTGDFEVQNQYLTNKMPAQEAALMQETSVALVMGQRLRVGGHLFIDSVSDTANSIILIGIMGRLTGATDEPGVFLRLDVGADTASLHAENFFPFLSALATEDQTNWDLVPAQATSAVSLASTTAATPTLLNRVQPASTTIDKAFQEIEIISEPVDGGVRVRVYINERDLSKPTLEAVINRDFITSDSAFTDVGHAFIFFGKHTNARSFAVTYFDHEELVLDTEPLVTGRRDTPTLKEVRDDCYLVYERNTSSTDQETAAVDLFINWAVRDILGHLGDTCTFTRFEGIFNVTPGTNGYLNMPENVDRIISMERETSPGHPVPWSWSADNEHGSMHVQIINNESGNMRVVYQTRIEKAVDDGDHIIVPRKYQETVVTGAVMRMSRFGSDKALLMSIEQEYGRLLRQLKKSMNIELRQRNRKFHADPRGVHSTRYLSDLYVFGY